MKKYTVQVNGTDYEVIIKDNEERQNTENSNQKVKAENSTSQKTDQNVETELEKPEDMVAVEAPMSGKILSIKTDIGKNVKKGETIVTLEAMKMETEISAPVNGEIKAIKIGEGDNCKHGTVIALIKEAV